MNKKFLIFTIKLMAVIAATIGLYWLLYWFLWLCPYCPNAYDNAYQHALLLQYDALADDDRDNELIVFGASYVPFGVDVDTLQKVTGMKAQTLGVEGSMGTRILVDILDDTVRPGDTVVYVMGKSYDYYEEYTAVACSLESDKDKLKRYFDRRGITQKYYRDTMIWRKLYALFAGNLVEQVRLGISNKEQVYSLDSFDENGNMILLREGTLIDTIGLEEETLVFEDVDKKTMDVLNDFSKRCKKKDVRFVIVYGMLIDDTIRQSNEDTERYHRELSEYMEADIINKPQDGFMSAEYFYNHVYHLNTEGAKLYSTMIGEAINDYLACED